MNKQNRGDAPGVRENEPIFYQHPLNDVVPPSLFETGQAGVSHNLRDHNGKRRPTETILTKPNPAMVGGPGNTSPGKSRGIK